MGKQQKLKILRRAIKAEYPKATPEQLKYIYKDLKKKIDFKTIKHEKV